MTTPAVAADMRQKDEGPTIEGPITPMVVKNDRQTEMAHPFEAQIPAMPGEREFEGLMKMSDMMAKSGFLPAKLNTAGKVLAVILTGRELGLPPMMSTRSIRLVDGNPVISADVLLGAFKRMGGRSKFITLTDKIATIWVRHPNGDEHTESFTIEMAGAAGLLSKDNWKKYRQAMLRSRVITAALKSLGWEPAAGVYSPDEAEEIEASRGIPTTVTATVSGEEVTSTDSGAKPEPAVMIRGRRLDERKEKTEGGGYCLSVDALKANLQWGGDQLSNAKSEDDARKFERFIAAVTAEIKRRQQEDADALDTMAKDDKPSRTVEEQYNAETIEERYNAEKARRLHDLETELDGVDQSYT